MAEDFPRSKSRSFDMRIQRFCCPLVLLLGALPWRMDMPIFRPTLDPKRSPSPAFACLPATVRAGGSAPLKTRSPGRCLQECHDEESHPNGASTREPLTTIAAMGHDNVT